MTRRPIIERDFDFEVRDAGDGGDGLTLAGYAAVFDSPTRIDSWEGLFDEQMARGAFKKTIAERTPVLMWNHGHDPAVGQVPIGVIKTLREDARGLYVEARLHDNAHAGPVRDAIASGAVNGMSIRFEPLDTAIDESGDVPLHTLRAVKLHELGPVAFPAYTDTLVGVRNQDPATTSQQAAQAPVGDAGAAHAPASTTRDTQSLLVRERLLAAAHAYRSTT